MELFFATRFGHDQAEDGPNGPDTHFIVRALDRDEAVRIVDYCLLNNLLHKKVEPLCHRITELGTDSSQKSEATIICGPWYEYLSTDFKKYTTWVREAQTEYKWIEMEKFFKD